LLVQFRKNALEQAKNFDLDRILNQYLEVYEEMIALTDAKSAANSPL
jgi:hypothetical protein